MISTPTYVAIYRQGICDPQQASDAVQNFALTSSFVNVQVF